MKNALNVGVKDMSKLTEQTPASKAYMLHERLLGVVEDTKRNFFLVGALLAEIHDNEYWELMGYESFRSYIADPEIAIKYSTAYHAMNVVRKFELEETIGINYSKLIMIAPHLQDDNKVELLEKARSLSQSDLRIEIRTLKGEENPEARMVTCPHCNKEFEI